MSLRDQLDVCIVFLNRTAQTIECVDSLRGVEPHTTLLNNGSVDSCRKQVADHCAGLSWVTILDSSANLGCSGGRNLLIQRTRRPWLLFLDNDTTVRTPDWFDRFETHVRTWPDTEVFSPRLYDVHLEAYRPTSAMQIENGMAVHVDTEGAPSNLFPGGASFVRRTLFERLGVYDPEMEGIEDWDLALGAAGRGSPLHCRQMLDIEIHHHHRPASTAEDRDYANTRAPAGRTDRLRAKLLQRHGVMYDAGRQWEKYLARYLALTLGPSNQQD